MPLWKPYATDEALDLRTLALKKEPASLPPVHESPYPQISPDYASVREAFSSAASTQQNQMQFVVSPTQYMHASSAHVPYGPYQTPEQSGYAQNPLAYHYLGSEMVPHTIPEPQYHRYPAPTTQISPASSTSDAACLKSATSSPPTDNLSEDEDFLIYEQNALRAMALRNGGSLFGDNPRMRRIVQTNQKAADDSYSSQRQRNNIAAKQSRDRRKLRELKLTLKVSYLSNILATLRAELASRYCRSCQQSCGSSE